MPVKVSLFYQPVINTKFHISDHHEVHKVSLSFFLFIRKMRSWHIKNIVCMMQNQLKAISI